MTTRAQTPFNSRTGAGANALDARSFARQRMDDRAGEAAEFGGPTLFDKSISYPDNSQRLGLERDLCNWAWHAAA
jgi:hypothetical protein